VVSFFVATAKMLAAEKEKPRNGGGAWLAQRRASVFPSCVASSLSRMS